MDIEKELTPTQALDLAITALDEQAQQYHFDARAIETFGSKAPHDVRRRAAKRQKLLLAIEQLKVIKHNNRES